MSSPTEPGAETTDHERSRWHCGQSCQLLLQQFIVNDNRVKDRVEVPCWHKAVSKCWFSWKLPFDVWTLSYETAAIVSAGDFLLFLTVLLILWVPLAWRVSVQKTEITLLKMLMQFIIMRTTSDQPHQCSLSAVEAPPTLHLSVLSVSATFEVELLSLALVWLMYWAVRWVLDLPCRDSLRIRSLSFYCASFLCGGNSSIWSQLLERTGWHLVTPLPHFLTIAHLLHSWAPVSHPYLPCSSTSAQEHCHCNSSGWRYCGILEKIREGNHSTKEDYSRKWQLPMFSSAPCFQNWAMKLFNKLQYVLSDDCTGVNIFE